MTAFVFAILEHVVPKIVNFPEGMDGFVVFVEYREWRGVIIFLKNGISGKVGP